MLYRRLDLKSQHAFSISAFNIHSTYTTVTYCLNVRMFLMFHNEKFQNVPKNKFLHFKEHFGIWYNVGCLDPNRLISLPYKLLTIIVTNRDHMAPYEPLRPTTDPYDPLRTTTTHNGPLRAKKLTWFAVFSRFRKKTFRFSLIFSSFFILSRYGCGIS